MTERQQLAFLLRQTAPPKGSDSEEDKVPKKPKSDRGRKHEEAKEDCALCNPSSKALLLCRSCDKKYPTQKSIKASN